ncbi:MAG: hypothetical protein E7652_07095 [Ruminococcaceae bacterium]|nr:hypothetical protein [Oscillospiraceae bacterium]
MIDLLTLHKQFLLPHIKQGDTVADFTMGNGHDTLWLSQQVGEKGKVYAFDIQAQAVESTSKILEESGAPKNYILIHDSHANAKEHIKEKIKAGVFNLGYLPGGDKSITTKRDSTLLAVEAAIDLLDADGIVLIAVYPGHDEGTVEGNLLYEMLSQISRFKLCISQFKIINSPTSPFFYMIESKENRG